MAGRKAGKMGMAVLSYIALGTLLLESPPAGEPDYVEPRDLQGSR